MPLEDSLENTTRIATSSGSPILYQNQERTITILDIPTSIAHAQGTVSEPNRLILLSSEPRHEPYPSIESKQQLPKKAAQNSVIERSSHKEVSELDAVYTNLIHDAMDELRGLGVQTNCLPRRISNVAPSRVPSKRKAPELDKTKQTVELELDAKGHIDPETSSVHEGKLSQLFEKVIDQDLTVKVDYADEDGEVLEQWDGSFHNYSNKSARMTIPGPHIFTIPPESTLVLGDCSTPAHFRSTLRFYSSEADMKRIFDFILMDPPWPNASVKRKEAYFISHMLRDTKTLLLSMDLDQCVAPNGLMGIWITNRPSIRQLVLGHGGIFESLNVGLIEEWIWVKTTTKGEPVTALDGAWRKPYEVLLLARSPGWRLETARHSPDVKRRIIFGVPDIHSRKPCLKELIEDMLPEGYQALECFARYLVAGWWSWGNEVLKFNWDGYWTDGAEQGGLKKEKRAIVSIADDW